MWKSSFLKAQGTIEYVVLLAIIVVIGLVVVVLASGFVESGPGVTKGKSELYWSSQDVGIVDSVVDSNGDGVFRFANNGVGELTIVGLSVDGVDANVSSTRVLGGGKVSVSVGGLSACIGGSRSYVIKITYRDQYGIQHVVSGGELVVNCTPDVFRDVVPPVVSLVSPSDGSVDEDGVVGFVYSVSDNMGVSSCSLVVDSVVDQTDSSAPFGSFDKNFVLLGEGVYSWNVRCVDGGGNSADSNNGSWDVNYDIFEDGSYAHPFLLSSCIELQDMNQDLDANYALAQDIDCSDTINWNSGAGFAPVGNDPNVFNGNFDGRNYSIRNLYIYRPNTNNAGLFGYTSGSNIWDVGLLDVNVTGSNTVGGLTGYQFSGTISNSYSTGTITGADNVGGLVGDQYSGTISNSYSTGTVTSLGDSGGLVGDQYGGTISNSYSTGTVTGNWGTGGLVAYQGSGTISNSYSTGTVNSNDDAIGGLVGYQHGTISNSYSTGAVTGDWAIGGLVGLQDGGTISNSYSTGSVTGSDDVGGLVGWQEGGPISNSYSTGSVTGSDDVGGLVGYHDSGAISNCGWWTGAGPGSAIGNPDGNVTYNEADAAVFYSYDHNVYDTVVPYWTFGVDGNWSATLDDINYPILAWQVE